MEKCWCCSTGTGNHEVSELPRPAQVSNNPLCTLCAVEPALGMWPGIEHQQNSKCVSGKAVLL